MRQVIDVTFSPALMATTVQSASNSARPDASAGKTPALRPSILQRLGQRVPKQLSQSGRKRAATFYTIRIFLMQHEVGRPGVIETAPFRYTLPTPTWTAKGGVASSALQRRKGQNE